MSSPTIRAARTEDCHHIAWLAMMGSDGLVRYIWQKFAPRPDATLSDEQLIDIGATWYAREGRLFSYQNCAVATAGDQCLGMLHTYPMRAKDETKPETDPVLKPYAELTDYGSLYICNVAVYPQHRVRGIGWMLMAEAERQARAAALPRLSLMCLEGNHPALRLYHRLGFIEKDRRPIVPHPSLHQTDGDVILLHRHLD